MHKSDYVIIAAALRKVRLTWGLTDSINTRDEAIFNDVVDAINRAFGKDNSAFSPEKFSAAVYGYQEQPAQFVQDEQRASDAAFLESYSPE